MKNILFSARSHFSIGESTLKIKESKELREIKKEAGIVSLGLVTRAKEAGFDTVVLCDTMSVSGIIDFTQEAKDQGIEPLIGARLRIAESVEHGIKSGTADNPEYYLKVFPKNEEGFAAILRLLTLANTEERFYYKPRLLLSDVLAELASKTLIASTGDAFSVFTQANSAEIVSRISDAAGRAQTFVEICPVDTPLWDQMNMRALYAARKNNLGLVLSYPALYETEEGGVALDMHSAIASNAKRGWMNNEFTKSFFIPADRAENVKRAIALKDRLARDYKFTMSGEEVKSAVTNQLAFAEAVSFRWQKRDVCLPKMAEDEFGELVRFCKEGWKERFTKPIFGHSPEDLAPYAERLKYELSVLKAMDFSGYFLLVRDIVMWSKSNGISVGPGRGSVGGSLVAYLLGITDVDPLRFGLLFERFINPERIDLPDADLDFMSTRRAEVIQYMTDKYGADCVAGISNFTAMQGAGAIRDVGRVLELSHGALSVTRHVPKEHGIPVPLLKAAKTVGELEQFSKDYAECWNYAISLEGVMRSLGRHAAGVVVAGEPLVKRAVVEKRSGEPTVNWDKRVVEDMGLVKIDILGLSTLDILKLATDFIKRRHGKTVDLLTIPLDDPKVLDAFGRGNTTGIFQFESSGMKNLLRQLSVDVPLTFDEIVAATALYRPGPMDAGLMDEYIQIKQGMIEPNVDHPNMADALKETSGIIVYQEQVMQIARDLAGFTMAEADHLRKAMGKKDKEKMAKQKEKFVSGAAEHSGMKASDADRIFEKILLFAGYAFNKSHSVEYSLISYQAMWLKVYYPVEFFAASLTILDEDRLPALVDDAKVNGIKVNAPDINYSTNVFEILNDTTLLIPFNRVKGISENGVKAIEEARAKAGGKFESKAQFIDLVEKRKCNSRVVERLEQIGAFARITPGAPPPDHPDRMKAQMEFVPGLMSGVMKATRAIPNDEETKKALTHIIYDYQRFDGSDLTEGLDEEQCKMMHPLIRLGRKPKFMVVADGPYFSEVERGRLVTGKVEDILKSALKSADLNLNDGYFTALVKAQKADGDKFYSAEQIRLYSQFLDREVELLKPPVIVCLGTAASKHFVKDLKSAHESNGKVAYDPALDAQIIVGISTGYVMYEPSAESKLREIFEKVAEIVL